MAYFILRTAQEKPVIGSRLSVISYRLAGFQFASLIRPINRKQKNLKLKTENRRLITEFSGATHRLSLFVSKRFQELFTGSLTLLFHLSLTVLVHYR